MAALLLIRKRKDGPGWSRHGRLVTVERANSAWNRCYGTVSIESAMNAGEAAQALDADADKLADAYARRPRSWPRRRKVQRAKRRGARPSGAQRVQRLADLEAGVQTRPQKKHLDGPERGRRAGEMLRDEASKATEKLRDSEGRQRELETQAKLAQTKSEDLTRKLEGASTELDTVQQKVDQVTSDLNDAKKALSSTEASLREVREEASRIL